MALALWRGLPQMKSETHLNTHSCWVPFSVCLSAIKFCVPRVAGLPDLCQFQHSLDLNGFLLAAPPFNYSDGVIGLFGLRELPERWALVRRAVLPIRAIAPHHNFRSAAAITFMAGDLFGHTSVLALIIGILVLDLTVRACISLTRR